MRSAKHVPMTAKAFRRLKCRQLRAILRQMYDLERGPMIGCALLPKEIYGPMDAGFQLLRQAYDGLKEKRAKA